LVRNPNVTDGNTTNALGFPALQTEWIEYPVNTSSYLGSHTVASIPSSGVPVTLTVTDIHGNVSTCTANVTVEDNIAPVITTNGNQSLNNDLGACGATFIATATATDNCSVEAPTGVRDDGEALNALYPVGTTVITWNVTDVNGNEAIAVTQTIVVTDNEAPTAVCQDITVQLDANGNATITAAQIDGGSTDNCEIATIMASQTTFDCSDVTSGGNTTPPSVWINEIHYDNDGADVNEFIEVAGTAGLNLSEYSIILYNGSNGLSYATINLSGVIDNEGTGFGALSFAASGMQNGAPDGLALVDNLGNVLEFISYEGSFSATNGVANGSTSTDIGVNESGSEVAGNSLQKTGDANSTWTGPSTASPGSLNAGQNLSSGGLGVPIVLTVTDVNGNVSTCVANITVVDIIAPVILPMVTKHLITI
jgi:hypothetical protein